MLASLFILFFTLVFLNVYLTGYLCLRRRTPDFWDEKVLVSKAFTETERNVILSGKQWITARKPQDVETIGDDGTRLRGLLIGNVKAKGTFLLFHDCRSSCKTDFPRAARFLYEQGFQVILADERAHGKSGGWFTSLGIWERFDVRSWASFVENRFGPEHPMYILGSGMGADAVLMASPLVLPGNVRGLVAESACPSPYDCAAQRLHALLPLPKRFLMALTGLSVHLLFGFGLNDSSPLRAIAEADYPLLLIHGGKDLTASLPEIQKMYELCLSEKQFLEIPEAAHGRCWQTDPESVENALKRFIDATLSPS